MADAFCDCFQPADEASKRSRELDARLRKDKRKYDAELRLLLLGAGESGKSTIVKQMHLIQGGSFEDQAAEMRQYRTDVVRNVIINMAAIIECLEDGGDPLEPAIRLARPDNAEPCAVVRDVARHMTDNAKDREWCAEKLQGIETNPQPFVDQIASLWADAGVQAAFARSNEYQLSDSAKYFFDRLPVLHAEGWRCTNQDVIRVRNQTSGITERCFEMSGHSFRILDVGGQRQERRKWIQCFADVTSIIWVVSTSAFDQKLREDNQSNRLKESIKLFEELWRNRFLRRISVILFLNKTDLLLEKMKRPRAGARLQYYFSDYSGSDDVKTAMEFILKRFEAITELYRLKENGGLTAKNLYSHFTCAVDTQNIELVFNACQDIIIRLNLVALGLV